jgi:hypothetical protein
VGLGIGRRVQGCFNGDYVWPSEPFKDGFRPLRNPRSYHSRLGFAYQVAFVRLFDRFPQQQGKARLSPLIHEHINTQGRHSFVMPEAVVKGELRPLRNPADDPD